MNITVNGTELNLVKDILGSAFISDKNRKKKLIKFEGWRAVAVKALLKELKEQVVTEEEKEDEETPIFQAMIMDKNHKPASEGWTWIKFAGIPNEEIRIALKNNGFKFTQKYGGKWYQAEVKTNTDEVTEILRPYYVELT